MHVVTADEMYQMDRFTMQSVGIPGVVLMENAGRAVSDLVQSKVSRDEAVVVLIGTGNNGGDGFVIARTLKNRGYTVDVWLIPPVEKLKGDALTHYHIYRQAGLELYEYENEDSVLFKQQLEKSDWIVDAMLGIGVKGNLREPYANIIRECNDANAHVIAVDIPSGVPADGHVMCETAIQAKLTVAIQFPKQSAFVFPHASYYGELEVVDIGIPPLALQCKQREQRCWTDADVTRTFPVRGDNSHKGTYGKGLLFAGSRTMSGAALMTAKAAVKSGTGLLSGAVPDVIQLTVASQLPEVMFHPIPSDGNGVSGAHELNVGEFDAVAAGPGLGRTDGVGKLIISLLETVEAPLILDADGLYHLAGCLELLQSRTYPTVITPHAGEMARLIGRTAQEVEADRFGIARQFAIEYGVYLLLKGRYTIVTTPEGDQFVNVTGNAALAKGGSGDVLTGMVLAFVLQQDGIQAAVSNACYFHGSAADWLIREKHSLLDVLPSNIIESLPYVFKPFDTNG